MEQKEGGAGMALVECYFRKLFKNSGSYTVAMYTLKCMTVHNFMPSLQHNAGTSLFMIMSLC